MIYTSVFLTLSIPVWGYRVARAYPAAEGQRWGTPCTLHLLIAGQHRDKQSYRPDSCLRHHLEITINLWSRRAQTKPTHELHTTRDLNLGVFALRLFLHECKASKNYHASPPHSLLNIRSSHICSLFFTLQISSFSNIVFASAVNSPQFV